MRERETDRETRARHTAYNYSEKCRYNFWSYFFSFFLISFAKNRTVVVYNKEYSTYRSMNVNVKEEVNVKVPTKKSKETDLRNKIRKGRT